MQVNSDKPQRRSIRLKDYDYSQPGSYFVTICTHGHKNLFGVIVNVRAGSEPARTDAACTEPAKMILNPYGEIVLFKWNDLVNHNTGIKLGEFVIMPNHIHGIIHILDPETDWDSFIPSEFLYFNDRKDSTQTGSNNSILSDSQLGSVSTEHVRAGSEPARTNPTCTNPARNPTRTDSICTRPSNSNNKKQVPLSEIIRQFKTFSARRINEARKTPGIPVWKRDYYEHVIRNQESYDQIVEYIQNNPLMWKLDKLYIE